MNYYPFHLGDYAAHTAHLEPMEDLAYRRMLDLYYLRECALPADPSEVARLIRMKANVSDVESVLREFFVQCEEGDWIHARCEEEISRMQDKQEKARASAAASVNARKANAQRTLNERSTTVELPTPTPIPNTSEAKASDGKPSRVESEKPKNQDDKAKAEVWKAAVSVLADGGCPNESQARTFMGKLVGDYTFPVVKEAITAAVMQQPADAREYLKATCMRLTGDRKDPVTVPSDEPEKTAALLAEQDAHRRAAASPENRERARQALAQARSALTRVTQ